MLDLDRRIIERKLNNLKEQLQGTMDNNVLENSYKSNKEVIELQTYVRELKDSIRPSKEYLETLLDKLNKMDTILDEKGMATTENIRGKDIYNLANDTNRLITGIDITLKDQNPVFLLTEFDCKRTSIGNTYVLELLENTSLDKFDLGSKRELIQNNIEASKAVINSSISTGVKHLTPEIQTVLTSLLKPYLDERLEMEE